MTTPAQPLRMDPALVAIAKAGEARIYKPGATLAQEGEALTSFYVVLSGQLQLLSADDASVIGTIEPGEYTGELALDGGKSVFSVVTSAVTCCSVISVTKLRELLAVDGWIALYLIEALVSRLRASLNATAWKQ